MGLQIALFGGWFFCFFWIRNKKFINYEREYKRDEESLENTIITTDNSSF